MQTETITWRQLAEGLPDAETNVLLTLAGEEPGTCEGFLDGEWETGSHKGQPLFRDVTAQALPAGDVTHWAHMPKGAGGAQVAKGINAGNSGQECTHGVAAVAPDERWHTYECGKCVRCGKPAPVQPALPCGVALPDGGQHG